MKHSENGFTLVELLVAISIFAIVMATVIQGITYNAQVNNMTEARGEAVVVTRQVLDDYRGRTSLPSSGTETISPRPHPMMVSANGATPRPTMRIARPWLWADCCNHSAMRA